MFIGFLFYLFRFNILVISHKKVKDTSTDNLSWSTVPHGLRVFQDEIGSHIISVQKFAKGCRFGPLMAPKSYIPIQNTKFPLNIFGTVNLDVDAMYMPELRDLFQARQIFLDTRNEKFCNWMIHVDPAQYSNEQNLIAYEEDNEIFFAAIEDLDAGDILKVWYSPKYGVSMKMPALQESPFPITKNVLGRCGFALPEAQLLLPSYDQEPNRTGMQLKINQRVFLYRYFIEPKSGLKCLHVIFFFSLFSQKLCCRPSKQSSNRHHM